MSVMKSLHVMLLYEVARALCALALSYLTLSFGRFTASCGVMLTSGS